MLEEACESEEEARKERFGRRNEEFMNEETKNEESKVELQGGGEMVPPVESRARLEGKLESYVPGDSFEDYLEQVDNYFELNKLENDERKVRLLINLIGSAASSKVIKSFKPEVYSTKTYAEVIAQCKKLFV